jgi:hypothetical protein
MFLHDYEKEYIKLKTKKNLSGISALIAVRQFGMLCNM